MIALLADIHGNLHALEAVLADMPKVSQIWVLGDMAVTAPFPCEVLDRLLNLDVPTYAVKGNGDEYLLEGRKGNHPEWWKGRQFGNLAWTVDSLKPHHWAYIESLPETLRLENIPHHALLYHGTPSHIAGAILTQKDAEEVASSDTVKWFIGGHRHKTRLFKVGEQRIVIPGSVGISIDGIGGVACYALIDERTGDISFRHVSYDIDAAVNAIYNSPLPEICPGIMKAFIAEMTTGRNYVMGLVLFAAEHAQKQLGYKPDTIPPELWDEAEELHDYSEWMDGRFDII